MAEHLRVLEDCFWSRRRPPLHLRDKVREGQRFTNGCIELFFVRPAYKRPGEEIEESIAKVQHLSGWVFGGSSGNGRAGAGSATNRVRR